MSALAMDEPTEDVDVSVDGACGQDCRQPVFGEGRVRRGASHWLQVLGENESPRRASPWATPRPTASFHTLGSLGDPE